MTTLTLSDFRRTTYGSWAAADGPNYDTVMALLMEAHDGELPNDWRWDTAVEIISYVPVGDDTDDDAFWLVESIVGSMSYSELFSWYAEMPSRIEYLPEDQGMAHDLIRQGVADAVYRMIEVLR